MPQVEQIIEINAPPAAVFAVIADQPERMPEWWALFEQQERVTPPPTAVGTVSRYVFNLMGIRIKGEHQVLQIEDARHLVIKTVSGIDGMFDFSLADTADGGTRLTVRAAYALPGSVLGQRINRLTIEQKNERDLHEGLLNLKALLENEKHP
ncbi:MAG: SRPBCC family protein [Anaerolineae bacterium]|nr:SRPBCC family protein [Anaerolineae bacterium]